MRENQDALQPPAPPPILERVAAAIARKQGIAYEALPEGFRACWRDKAAAAIEAMLPSSVETDAASLLSSNVVPLIRPRPIDGGDMPPAA